MTHGKDKGKVTLAVKALMPREEDTVNVKYSKEGWPWGWKALRRRWGLPKGGEDRGIRESSTSPGLEAGMSSQVCRTDSGWSVSNLSHPPRVRVGGRGQKFSLRMLAREGNSGHV